MARITVVGSLNMDLVVRTPRIPKPGETIIGTDLPPHPRRQGGKSGCRGGQAAAEVYMIGRVGQDDFGQALLDNLAQSGVNTECVIRDTDAPSRHRSDYRGGVRTKQHRPGSRSQYAAHRRGPGCR